MEVIGQHMINGQPCKISRIRLPGMLKYSYVLEYAGETRTFDTLGEVIKAMDTLRRLEAAKEGAYK